ncbi:hypothetical protein LAZ67_7002970 [Cordylochernes scorpioides]|uniref:Uncharacterized protein n=1 Tax=Cordylochernes scorpioides TaxID=51811 RepID=A0ABY6KNI5_9ARAC|nr:hypothetical protein LAZ67_7002970 [Cordylochernes scorpioides]
METSEALHWTRQQQQKIEMDPEQQLYIPKIENDCCDRDAWRHLRLFIGHDNNNRKLKWTQNSSFTYPRLGYCECYDRDAWRHILLLLSLVHVVQAMIIMVGRSWRLLFTDMQQLSWCGTNTYSHILMPSNGRSALHKIDIDPEQQLYTPKIVDIAAAVIKMHGDICGSSLDTTTTTTTLMSSTDPHQQALQA